MRLCVIANPVAGQSRPGSALPQIEEYLSAWAERLEIRETGGKGDGERIARGIGPGEFDVVAAAGGDGTINEVLNGLGDHTAFGLIPLGTANVLARELKIPVNDLRAACEVLRTGQPRPMDLGWCNGRRFCLMAGIGFDAEAVKEVVPNVKDLIGAPAYILSGLRALTIIKSPIRYRIYQPDRRRMVFRGMMLVVANASGYGGPIQIATDAGVDDGWLDLCLFRERRKLQFLWQWVLVLLRRHRDDPHFVYRRAKEVRVECTPPAAVQLDGDYFGRTPVEIRVLPDAVSVIRPAPTATLHAGA